MISHLGQRSFLFAKSPPPPDPTLLAIADCAYAWKLYGAAISERDDPDASDETRDLFDARTTEAMNAWEVTWRRVLDVTPTTVPGAVALASFLASHNEDAGGDGSAQVALSALATSLKYFAGAA